jgi:hypothetical protein
VSLLGGNGQPNPVGGNSDSWTSWIHTHKDLRSIACRCCSADGKTVVCGSISIAAGTERKPVAWRLSWLAYSIPTGSVRTLYQVTVRTTKTPYSYGLWTSASGRTMIGEWSVTLARPALQDVPYVGVISDGTFAPSATW